MVQEELLWLRNLEGVKVLKEASGAETLLGTRLFRPCIPKKVGY